MDENQQSEDVVVVQQSSEVTIEGVGESKKFVDFTIKVGPAPYVVYTDVKLTGLSRAPKHVFLQARQGRDFKWPEWTDTFSTNVAGISKDRLAFRVARAGGGGWTMELEVDVLLVF